MAIVSIKDTGTGIDPEIMPRLFENLHQSLIKEPDWGHIIQKHCRSPLR
jgi:hypothetical protein